MEHLNQYKNLLGKQVRIVSGNYMKQTVRPGGLTCIAISLDGTLLIKGFKSGHTGRSTSIYVGHHSPTMDCLWIFPKNVKLYKKKKNPDRLFDIDEL